MASYLSKLNVNGQEYQIKDANAATAIELASKVGYGYYNSETSEIVFYDKEDTNSRTELFSIDATGFIKDGMVSNVAISDGNLVITFNTAAGQEPISIALTEIFNPANYYDKAAMDGKLADYPTINTMNTALGQKANVTDIYTQTEINNKLDAKANSADLATVATSGSYNDLKDKPVIPEGAVVDAELSDTSENPVQNKVVKAAIDTKQGTISDLETIRSGAARGATAYQKPSTGIPASDIAEGVIPTVPTNVSAFTNDAGYLTQHQSLDNYYTKQEVNGLTSNFFDKAIYDSDNKAIIFKNGDDVIATIDATGFIKDGMVSNVEILESNLVITFNTDAGKEPISIALTDIFNPANYYNKTEVDGKLALKADASNVYTKEDADSKFLTEHQSLDNYYTKTQVNEALTLKQDANTAFSGDYNDLTNKPDLSVYAESADLATVATSGDYNDLTNKPTIPAAQVNADWDASSGVAQILNKPTNVSVFANDAGYLTEHQSLNNYYTKLEVDNQFTAIDKRMTDFDKGIDDLELIVSSSLNDLNARIEEISSDNTNQFTAINKRITDFDEGIDDLELIVSSSLNDINTRVETNLSTINSLLNKINKLTQRVTALENAKNTSAG